MLQFIHPQPVDPTQQLNQLALPSGALPLTIGTLTPGGPPSTKQFTLTVTGDGSYQLQAFATYTDQSNATGSATTIGGQFKATVPLLYFKASTTDTEVKAGSPWDVTGQVKDESSFQTVCLSPLQPTFADNAGGLGPLQLGVVPAGEPSPALAGTIKPGQTILFNEQVLTEAITPGAVGLGTTSSVVLAPAATLGVPGDACKVADIGQRTALAKSDITIAPNSRFFQVDVTPAAASAGGAGALEYFGGYADRSAALVAQLFESGCSLVKEYGSIEGLEKAADKGASGLLNAQAAVSRIYHSAALYAMFWYYADPGERQEFENEVAEAFTAKTGVVWDGVQSTVEKDVDAWMTELEKAYLSGNWSSLFHALGASSADFLNEQAITMASWELAIGVVSKVGTFGQVLRRYELSEGQSKFLESLKTVPIGRLLNFEEMQRLWGLAYEDYQAFQRISHEYGVLIGVRGRSPISVENLADGAVWKHENLKPKNVSSIDTEYLGFQKSDTGLVAFRTYTDAQKAAIESRIAGLNPELQEVVQKRFDTRLEEADYVNTIEGYSKDGKIDVGFNYADNGVKLDSTSKVRGFTLDSESIDGGGTYYRPYQENPALNGLADGKGKLPKDASLCIRKLIKKVKQLLCRVSGDMDGVYLTGVDNTALTEAKRIQVYNALAAVGWQHPETLTWIKSGLFDFEKKTKILTGLELGGEPMMEFAPDGTVRATYLSLNASRLSSVNDYFVGVLGGYTSFFHPQITTP